MHIQRQLELVGAKVLFNCLELDVEAAVSPGLAEEAPGAEIKKTTSVYSATFSQDLHADKDRL